jgi:Phospholipase_D-nuclease N-terminal
MTVAQALGIGLLAGGFWILGIVAVLLAIGALVSVFRNADLSGSAKAMWVVAILIFPLFGSLIYFGVRSDW